MSAREQKQHEVKELDNNVNDYRGILSINTLIGTMTFRLPQGRVDFDTPTNTILSHHLRDECQSNLKHAVIDEDPDEYPGNVRHEGFVYYDAITPVRFRPTRSFRRIRVVNNRGIIIFYDGELEWGPKPGNDPTEDRNGLLFDLLGKYGVIYADYIVEGHVYRGVFVDDGDGHMYIEHEL
jgi:hypothetical protein